MIVLHEDDRFVAVPDLLEDGVGEPAIDGLVVLPIVGPKDRARVGDVTEGPEALIGEALVVALFLGV